MRAAAVQTPPRRGVNFSQRPMLVFWETTRACSVACRHCRASATLEALTGQLTTAEGRQLIDQVVGFGRPYPVLVLTGGDCLLRPDLFELIDYATHLKVPVALSPSVTPLLTPQKVAEITASGVKAISISLDGATAATHENIRAIAGHFAATTSAISALAKTGMTVQVNTTVMRSNVAELADIAALVSSLGAQVWEVFFVVPVGRGTAVDAVTPEEHEDVCHFLYDASRHGFVVRTVEAPFFRRVVRSRREGGECPDRPLSRLLRRRLSELFGPPTQRCGAHTTATRDGKGILFIAHDGEVYPAGFLPLGLGNIRSRSLRVIYRDDPLLRAIRAAHFTGRCGRCEYADLCGGSRARAYATSGDPLGEDSACSFVPDAATPGPLASGDHRNRPAELRPRAP